MKKDNESYKGYRSKTLATLQRFKALIWSDVEIKTTNGLYKGLILPRSETADEHHIVLKLVSGYNVGIASDKVKTIKVIGRKVANYKIPEQAFPYDPKKPKVKLFGTGGTIEIGRASCRERV